MKEEDVNCCQIQEWYPKFKSVSIKTLIHELPETFIQYLLDDSGPFLLPASVLNEDALPNRIHNSVDEEDFQVSEGSGDEAEETSPPPSFPELELKVKESIESLGGSVFPKLNWSAPKDSAWISTSGTLCCTNFSEIALLFRASDSLVHDLCHAYDSCHDKLSSRPCSFFLAIRKWYPSLKPDMEFRCFVRNQKLVGISQREVTTFYPVLLENKNDLLLLIQGFFNNYVRTKFESENYTFDVYVTMDERVQNPEIPNLSPSTPHTAREMGSDSEGEKSAHKEREKKKMLALAPIAKPLAGKKLCKKTLKLVRKAAENKCIKRGVKEVVKSIKRGQKGVCVIAGNISPIDVITHVPILCEEAEIPYVYVPSKEDLATAGATKRPTCCVLVMTKPAKGDIDQGVQEKLKSEYDQVATEITELTTSLF